MCVRTEQRYQRDTVTVKITDDIRATVKRSGLDWASLVAQTVKNLPANVGDLGLIPGSGRSPGEGNGNPPQCSCLENSVDRGAWRVTVQGVAKSQT